MTRSRLLLGLLAASSALSGPAWASGSAIQDLRSNHGLITNGRTASDTGGTGIYTEKQRREFGYDRTVGGQPSPSR